MKADAFLSVIEGVHDWKKLENIHVRVAGKNYTIDSIEFVDIDDSNALDIVINACKHV